MVEDQPVRFTDTLTFKELLNEVLTKETAQALIDATDFRELINKLIKVLTLILS